MRRHDQETSAHRRPRAVAQDPSAARRRRRGRDVGRHRKRRGRRARTARRRARGRLGGQRDHPWNDREPRLHERRAQGLLTETTRKPSIAATIRASRRPRRCPIAFTSARATTAPGHGAASRRSSPACAGAPSRNRWSAAANGATRSSSSAVSWAPRWPPASTPESSRPRLRRANAGDRPSPRPRANRRCTINQCQTLF